MSKALEVLSELAYGDPVHDYIRAKIAQHRYTPEASTWCLIRGVVIYGPEGWTQRERLENYITQLRHVEKTHYVAHILDVAEKFLEEFDVTIVTKTS